MKSKVKTKTSPKSQSPKMMAPGPPMRNGGKMPKKMGKKK